MNSILALTHKELYLCGLDAIHRLIFDEIQSKIHPNLHHWLSVYSAIQVISNRTTPPHRDKGGAPSYYDLLLSAGTHSDARMHIHDLGATFNYPPGTIILVCGRLLLHQVPPWGDGERICLAHYMRDNVHDRLSIIRADWVSFSSYTKGLMSEGFYSRQNFI
jgi:hypothetical protein